MIYPFHPQAPVAFISIRASLWHQHRGYHGAHVFNHLVASHLNDCNKTPNTIICQACQLGKHIQLPFSISSSIVSGLFDIIHSNMWKSLLESISGKNQLISNSILSCSLISSFLGLLPPQEIWCFFPNYFTLDHFIKNQFILKSNLFNVIMMVNFTIKNFTHFSTNMLLCFFSHALTLPNKTRNLNILYELSTISYVPLFYMLTYDQIFGSKHLIIIWQFTY